MKKTAATNVSQFTTQAQKTLSLAIEICENRINANNCHITPELRVLSAAVVSLDKAIIAFGEAERLFKDK